MRVYTFENMEDLNEFSKKFAEWIDDVLPNELPNETVGIAFNIYEDHDNYWSCEVVATDDFDAEDECGEWATCEISHFDTRENKLFAWQEISEFDVIQDKLKKSLTRYMENGQKSGILKETAGVGIGFVDGDLELIYVNQNKLQKGKQVYSMSQKISNP